MDVEAPLNAGVPLSSDVSHDYKLNGSSSKWQVSESDVIFSHS
jgi:hypothetical protein